MSKLKDLITSLQSSIKEASSYAYVYYDKETGKIEKVSGTKTQSDLNILKVPLEDAIPIFNGESKINDYTIFYDVAEKQTRLKKLNEDLLLDAASLMCYKLPKTESVNSFYSLTKEYKGIQVYIWKIGESYAKGNFVWYNNNVYILNIDVETAESLENISRLYIENVYLPLQIATPSHTLPDHPITRKQQEYKGIYVDVWYDELEHLAGQHVWHNGVVYKLKKDQAKNTAFKKSNCKIIAKDVKLYDDENKSLNFEKVEDYELFLDHRELFMFVPDVENEEYQTDRVTKFYYIDEHKIIHSDELTSSVQFTDMSDLKNGNLILLEKQIYLIDISKDVDIMVTQNLTTKKWEISINPLTAQFVNTTFFDRNAVLYFSVTKEGNPNFLYRPIKIQLSELVETKKIEIDFKTTKESKDVSVYTSKYFNEYTHEVIG